jgi:hypothetical protein
VLFLPRMRDGAWARRALQAYGIDFEERPADEPFVSLHWNGIVYTDVFGIADFLMFVGRLPVEGTRIGAPRGDGKLPGSPVALS